MKIFISSTVFDLIDVRAELSQHLRSMGVSPVLSDDKLSDFKVSPDVNSIETCLVNVRSSDAVIVILDRRYGPSLASAGFDDVSATHLEYQTALKEKIPVHLFVRDRLEADYSTWKRNKKSKDLQLRWVGEDLRLLSMLEEHAKLKKNSKRSNWFSTFTSSVDLKEAVSKLFEAELLPARLEESINRNEFPIFDIETNVESEIVNNVSSLNFHNTLKNVGGAAAFNVSVYWEATGSDDSIKSVVAPGQKTSLNFIYGLGPRHSSVEKNLIVEYESFIGIRVVDKFRVNGRIVSGVLISGSTLKTRNYIRIAKASIEIDNLNA